MAAFVTPMFRRRLRVAAARYLKNVVRLSGPLRAPARVGLWLAGLLAPVALVVAWLNHFGPWWLLAEALTFGLIVTFFAGFAYEWNLTRFEIDVAALPPDENQDIGLLVTNNGASGTFKAWVAHAGAEGITRPDYPDGDAELAWSNQYTGTEDILSGRTKRLEVVKWIPRCGQHDQIAIIGTQRVPDPTLKVHWEQTIDNKEALVHVLIAETAIDVCQKVTLTIKCSHDGKPPTVAVAKDGEPIPGFGLRQLP